MTGEKLPAAKTDQEILACTIGELKPLTSPIIVADYDPDSGSPRGLRPIRGQET